MVLVCVCSFTFIACLFGVIDDGWAWFGVLQIQIIIIIVTVVLRFGRIQRNIGWGRNEMKSVLDVPYWKRYSGWLPSIHLDLSHKHHLIIYFPLFSLFLSISSPANVVDDVYLVAKGECIIEPMDG